jgi:hypothetical protein
MVPYIYMFEKGLRDENIKSRGRTIFLLFSKTNKLDKPPR